MAVESYAKSRFFAGKSYHSDWKMRGSVGVKG